jgi:hypothetical protein
VAAVKVVRPGIVRLMIAARIKTVACIQARMSIGLMGLVIKGRVVKVVKVVKAGSRPRHRRLRPMATTANNLLTRSPPDRGLLVFTRPLLYSSGDRERTEWRV